MSDDWKGESLIRSVRRSPYERNGNKPGDGSKPEGRKRGRPKRPQQYCAVPDCLAPLDSQNRAGVCFHHMHSAQCGCGRCERKREKATQERRAGF